MSFLKNVHSFFLPYKVGKLKHLFDPLEEDFGNPTYLAAIANEI
jgi:hypothetical protein